MRKLLGVVAVCGFLSIGVFLPTIASATLIYDNGPLSPGGLNMTYYFVAEDFTLTQAVTLNSIRFWNIQGFPATCCYDGSITWGIYSTGACVPACQFGSSKPLAPLYGPTTTTAVTRTTTGGANDEFQNDVALPSVALPAGSYWLALHNGPLTTNSFETGNPSGSFYWETTTGTVPQGPAPPGGDPGRVCHPMVPTVNCISTTDWEPFSNTEYAFQLYGEAGVVPEPSTVLLLGSVLPALAGVSIHRRRKPSNR